MVIHSQNELVKNKKYFSGKQQVGRNDYFLSPAFGVVLYLVLQGRGQ